MHTSFFRLWFAKSSRPFFLAVSGDEPAVSDLVASLSEATMQQHGKCEPCGEQPPAVLLLAVHARAKQEEQERGLQELADQLHLVALVRGETLRVAALPVFLVLIHAEKLTRPEDDPRTWSGRVNSLLLEKTHQFTTLLHHRVARDRRLFGTMQMHYVAVGTPTFEPGEDINIPHSSHALLQQACETAHSFLLRHRQQSWRTGGFSVLLGTCLLLMAAMGVILGWHLYVPEQARIPRVQETQPNPAELARQQLQRLLRFDGYRLPSGTHWVRWFQDADAILAGSEPAEAFPPEQRERIRSLMASVRSIRERILFLGLVRVEKPPIPVIQPMTEPGPSLSQLHDRATAVRDYLQQKSLFAKEKEWPVETPTVIAREFEVAAQRAYDAWLEPVRWQLRQAMNEHGGDKRETWLQLVQTWLPVEALPHLEEWRAVALFLQQQAGQPPRDLIEELTAFVEREQETLDLRRVKIRLPITAVWSDGKKLELRVMALRLECRKEPGQMDEVDLIHYRWERQTPVLSSDTAIHEFTRVDGPGDQSGLLAVRPGQTLTATVEAVDQQNQRWLIMWSPVEQLVRWQSLHIFTESPRLFPAQQADSRQGVLLSQARWLTPSMAAWKLPDLWPKPDMQK